VRVTVGAKALARGNVEVKIRKTGEMQEIAVAEVKEWLRKYIDEETAK
jgi:histidyl-tRNA synthetase